MFQGHGRCLPEGPTERCELHIPAFMAALDAYKRHQGVAKDASRQVQEYIAFAASIDPKKYWAGVGHKRWASTK